MAWIPYFAAGDGSVPPLFALLAIMLLGVVLVSLLLVRFRQSLLVGYFLCGVAIANSPALGMLGEDAGHQLTAMADFGVILLMFTVGLEFSLRDLKYLRRWSLVGGGLQMGGCALLAGMAAWWAGCGLQAVIVASVAMAMSSTAVSIKSFHDQGLAASPGARFALAVAIFQDLFVILFLLILPILLTPGAGSGSLAAALGNLLWKGGGFVAVAWALSTWGIPRILHGVAMSRSRELFTLAVVGLLVGLAFLAGLLGLSLALGAFVAGLAVSESIFKHRILAEIERLKDLFLTLFFVSIGLTIQLDTAFQYGWQIITLALALLVLKTSVITVTGRWAGLSSGPALVGAAGLASAGEFSLLLLQKAEGANLWNSAFHQVLVAGSALSMGLVPAAIRWAAVWGARLDRSERRKHSVAHPIPAEARHRITDLRDHAVLCGFGPVGRQLDAALRDLGVPRLIIELNAETVKKLKAEGHAVLFADAADEVTWELAGLDRARLVAFTFTDSPVVAAGLHHIRERYPKITVIARARFGSDVARLQALGADHVIHDEAESGRAVAEVGKRIYEEM